MDAVVFLQVAAGFMGIVGSLSLAYSQFVSTRIQLAIRRDVVEARKEQKMVAEALVSQASAMEEIKINTNNLMTESLKNKGDAAHAAGVIEGKRLSGADNETIEAKAIAAATVLREAAEQAALVLQMAATNASKEQR